MKRRGRKQVAVYLPTAVLDEVDALAAKRDLSRSDILAERLSLKPKKMAKPKAVAAPLPKDIRKEADRIVQLIGKGLRATKSDAATKALFDAMDAIYPLAGLAAQSRSKNKKKRRISK